MLIVTLAGNFKAIPVVNVATNLITRIIAVSAMMMAIFAKNRCRLTIKPILMKNRLMKTSWNG